MKTSKIDFLWRKNLVVCTFGSFSTVFAMTIMLPFLPLYIEDIGIKSHSEITKWAGISYSIIFFTAGVIAPVWGKLGDLYGRKSMLVRASFGMALMTFLIGFVNNLPQLLICLFIIGLAGGYSSGSNILIATQVPKNKSAWALGIIAAGVMTGNLLGPLLGGYLSSMIGIRQTFWVASSIIFITFLLTIYFVQEPKKSKVQNTENKQYKFKNVTNKKLLAILLFTAFLLMFANFSIEPVLSLYIKHLVGNAGFVTEISGIILSITALGSIISSLSIGKIITRINSDRLIVLALGFASVLLLAQSFTQSIYLLIILRFIQGLVLGGLIPCISSLISKIFPQNLVGMIMGFSISAQFLGQFLGPLIGGFIGSYWSFNYIFFFTSFLLMIGALINFFNRKSYNLN